jgi:hypothetical protein
MAGKTHPYLEGHIGDLILLSGFTIAVLAFVVVFFVTKTESTLLGTLAATMGGALATYMQKRATATSTTNIDSANINKIDTAPSEPAKPGLEESPNENQGT